MNIKQVIVVRRKYPDGDGGTKGMRRGKEIAQCSHASLAFLTKNIVLCQGVAEFKQNLTEEEIEWLDGSFAKVCLQVDTEEELLDIHQKALDAGLKSNLVTDSGRTEFSEPTNTCLAIGPHQAEKIDVITGHLKLL